MNRPGRVPAWLTIAQLVAFVLMLLAFLCSRCGAQVQLLSDQDQRALKTLLPKLDEEHRQAVLDDPDTIWYTSAEMPPAFQIAWGLGYVDTSFFDARVNISGDRSDRGLVGGGSPNGEFPWQLSPGGTHASPFADSVKGLLLPKDEAGRRRPVALYRQDVNGPRRALVFQDFEGQRAQRAPRNNGLVKGTAWVFPEGTVLVEVLTTENPDGVPQPFEVRFRIKETEDWAVDIFRPFATPADLADAIQKQWPEWEQDTVRKAAVSYLRTPQPRRTMTLQDEAHDDENAFPAVTTGLYDLPRMRSADVDQLLTTTTYTSVAGEEWSPGVIAPTELNREHNIVTFNYMGGFLGNDRFGCIRCHHHVNRHADEFDADRGWYGRVRGSDGIFSWHPIDPASVSADGVRKDTSLRREFVEAGIVETYDPSKHPANLYRRAPNLPESRRYR